MKNLIKWIKELHLYFVSKRLVVVSKTGIANTYGRNNWHLVKFDK